MSIMGNGCLRLRGRKLFPYSTLVLRRRRSECVIAGTVDRIAGALQDAPLAIQILFLPPLLVWPPSPPGIPLRSRSTAASTPAVTHVLPQHIPFTPIRGEGGRNRSWWRNEE